MQNENPDPRKGFSIRLNDALSAIGLPVRGRTAKIRNLLPGSISEVAIRKWLVGEGYPETERVVMLAKIARVSVDYLLTGTPASERERTLSQQELIRAVDRVIQLSACDFLDPQIKLDLRVVGTELLKRI
ncbi:hypothetical protein [Aeromonas veronii]|uniref:hypothetical protein n=1 Tax=Aeromonas veronii TaxID=654 RepID=UPI000E090BE7|nr:hypothetical protein [Aeromonas veronii]RDE60930.1 hypothetical protein DV708_16650 [Aeromonas veronii]